MAITNSFLITYDFIIKKKKQYDFKNVFCQTNPKSNYNIFTIQKHMLWHENYYKEDWQQEMSFAKNDGVIRFVLCVLLCSTCNHLSFACLYLIKMCGLL
jgi:hypothetical protein